MNSHTYPYERWSRKQLLLFLTLVVIVFLSFTWTITYVQLGPPTSENWGIYAIAPLVVAIVGFIYTVCESSCCGWADEEPIRTPYES
jgi:hypothetical protein